MKKLLLTLGTAASISVPLLTVIACGEKKPPTNPIQYDAESKVLTFTGFKMDPHDEDQTYSALTEEISDLEFSEARTIILKGTVGDYSYEGTTDITTITFDNQSFSNLGELLNHNFTTSSAWHVLFDASAVNHSTIASELASTVLYSYHADDSGWKREDQDITDPSYAEDLYGIPLNEFNKISNTLSPDWEMKEFLFDPQTDSNNNTTYWKVVFASTKQPHRGTHEGTIIVDFNTALGENLQIDGQDYIPDEDKFILMSDYYNDGQLWSGNNKTGQVDSESYVDLVKGVTWEEDQGVVQIDNGDSIVVVYDDAQDDGIHVNNFEESVAFLDTSIAYNDDITNINRSLGNGYTNIKTVEGGATSEISLPLFKNGKLLPYIGGQTNHNDPNLTFQDTLRIINKQLDKDSFKAILSYYGFLDVIDENGDYVKDPDVIGANQAFMPFAAEEGLLTYEQIAKNAIKITYNNANSEFGLPASQFAFIEEDGSDYYQTSEFGKFSFGKNSWDVYEDHEYTDYTFKGRKNIYING